MIQESLQHLVTRLDTATNLITVGSYWKIKIAALSCCLVLFFSFPEYSYFKAGENPWSSWVFLQDRIQAPFSKSTGKLGSNEGNKVYRLTPILAARLYNSPHTLRNVAFLTLIEHLMGVMFFYLMAGIIFKITNDKNTAAYFTVGLSFLFLGKDFFWDISSWLIPFGYFFMLLAMISRNPVVIFMALFLGFWSDERMVLLSPLILLWWRINTENKDFWKIVVAYFANFTLFFVIRNQLTTNYIQSPISFRVYPKESGVDYFWALYDLLPEIPMGLLLPFEGYWIFIFIFIFLTIKSWKTPRFWWLMGGIAMLGGGFLVSFAVRDSTKGFSMLFPLLMITVKLLAETESPVFIKRLCMAAMLVSFAIPTYFYNGAYNLMTPIYYTPLKNALWWGLNALVTN